MFTHTADALLLTPFFPLNMQVLFFHDETMRSSFIKHLCPESEVQKFRVKELKERVLLKEALTKEQRAQIVETFIRHAFSQVNSCCRGLPHPLHQV